MVVAFANPLSQEGSALARRYVYPFFQQRWGMFVPAPSSNYRLFVDYECHGRHRYDLFSELVTAHQQNRLAGNEPLVLAFSNSIHYFEHATPLRKQLNGPVRNDIFFTMIEHSALNYIRVKHQCPVRAVKIILVICPSGAPQRVYYN